MCFVKSVFRRKREEEKQEEEEEEERRRKIRMLPGKAFALQWIQALSFPAFTVHTQNLSGLCIHIAFQFLELEKSYPKLLTLDASLWCSHRWSSPEVWQYVLCVDLIEAATWEGRERRGLHFRQSKTKTKNCQLVRDILGFAHGKALPYSRKVIFVFLINVILSPYTLFCPRLGKLTHLLWKDEK